MSFVTSFLTGLVPDWFWFLLSIWPWIAGGALAGLIAGAFLGRWAVVAIVGLLVALWLFARPATPEEGPVVTRTSRMRRREIKKEKIEEVLTWFDRVTGRG